MKKKDIDKLELCLDDWRDPSGIIAYAGDEVVSSDYCGYIDEFEDFLDEIGSRINLDEVKLILKADMTGVGNTDSDILKLARDCQNKLNAFLAVEKWKRKE